MVDSDSFSPSLDNEKQGEDDQEDIYRHKYTPDEDDEYIQVLIRRELTSQSSLIITTDWIVSARLDCIKWIFHAMTLMGFQLRTAYLSLAYFDKFLSRRMIDTYWAVRLLSVACLSLAAKIEECKVPLLEDFPMEDYYFEGKAIQRMEILVLNTLEWDMNLITPFHYLEYFISKIWNQNPPPPRNVVPIDLIYAIIKDLNLMSSRSSVIAAAATFFTLDKKLTRQSIETKIMTFACGVEIEDVLRCYIRMQELCQDKINLTPVQHIGADVYGNSSFAPVVNTKRKRLEFDDCDQ